MKSDSIYKKTQRTIQREYNDALEAAIKKSREYLSTAQKVQSGKIKPPSGLKTEAQQEAWRRGYLNRYLKKTQTVDNIVGEMQKAGVKCRKSITESLSKIYGVESGAVVDALKPYGIIQKKTTKQIEVLLDKNLSTFDKGALANLSDGSVAKKRLRREFAVGIMRGDNDEAMIDRIRKVTGMEEKHAQTVLRTERTRVGGMAQQFTAEEFYEKTKKRPKKRWICMFHNSRESHIDTHGEVVDFEERFSNGLLHPGDNDAPASETVNCQCEMEVFYEQR